MGRIIAKVRVANAVDRSKALELDALVDTGAAALVLPDAWRDKLGDFSVTRRMPVETAGQRTIEGEIVGPVVIRIEGFDEIATEAMFIHMEPRIGIRWACFKLDAWEAHVRELVDKLPDDTVLTLVDCHE